MELECRRFQRKDKKVGRPGATTKCVCGKERLLHSGFSPIGPNSVDITGQVFGRLTALRATEKRQGVRKNTIWELKCECGEIVERSVNNLRHALRVGSRPGCSKCAKGARTLKSAK